jgi:hypothetical protein
MNRKHICTDCREPIPNGKAVLRSVAFEQVAWHQECWDLAHAEPVLLSA